MKPSLRRLLYALLTLAWLALIALPAFTFVLAARGEIRFGDDPQRTLRLFLVSDENVSGIGLQRTRPAGEDPFCVETQVRYLLWRGRGENSASCQCYEGVNHANLVSTSAGRCVP